MNALRKISKKVESTELVPIREGFVFKVDCLPNDYRVSYEIQSLFNMQMKELYPFSRRISDFGGCAFFVPIGDISNRDFMHPLLPFLKSIDEKIASYPINALDSPLEYWIIRNTSSLDINARPLKNAAAPVKKGMKAFVEALGQSFKIPLCDGEKFSWSCVFWNHQDAMDAMVSWCEAFDGLVHKKKDNEVSLITVKRLIENNKGQIMPQEIMEWWLDSVSISGSPEVQKTKKTKLL